MGSVSSYGYSSPPPPLSPAPAPPVAPAPVPSSSIIPNSGAVDLEKPLDLNYGLGIPAGVNAPSDMLNGASYGQSGSIGELTAMLQQLLKQMQQSQEDDTLGDQAHLFLQKQGLFQSKPYEAPDHKGRADDSGYMNALYPGDSGDDGTSGMLQADPPLSSR